MGAPEDGTDEEEIFLKNRLMTGEEFAEKWEAEDRRDVNRCWLILQLTPWQMNVCEQVAKDKGYEIPDILRAGAYTVCRAWFEDVLQQEG